MFSKILMLILLSGSIVLSGCAGEDQSKKSVLEIKLGGNSGNSGENGKAEATTQELKCVSELGLSFSKYFAGKMSNSELKSFWGCFDDIITIYVDRSKRVTMDGIINVIQEFLDKSTSGINLKKYKSEFRFFKQALFGNKKDNFSQEEIKHLMRIINETFPEATKNLQKELPRAFDLKSKELLTEKEVSNSLKTLEESLFILTSQFKGSYSEKQLKSFAEFIDQEFLSKGNFKIKSFIPVLFNIKKLFLGGSPNTINSEEWPAVSRAGVKAYGALYKWKRLKGSHQAHEEKGFSVIDDIIKEFLVIISEGLSKNEKWSKKDINSLFVSIEALGFLPDNVKVEDLMAVWENLSLKIFKNENSEFDKNSLAIVESFYNSWAEAQSEIVTSSAVTGELKVFVDEMKWPLFYNQNNVLVFSEASSLSKSDLANSYSKFNLFYLFSSVLTDSYGSNSAMTWDELKLMFEDFKPLALKLNVEEGLYNSIPQLLFIFGNSFLPNSKADKVFHKHELVNVLSYALSSLGTQKLWIDLAGEECSIETVCMLEFLTTPEAWDAMPQWKSIVSKKAKADVGLPVLLSPFSDLEDKLSGTSLLIGSLLSQIIESLLITNDADKNGVLNTKETINVIESLWPALSVALGTDSLELKDTLLATSTYILKYNELPDVGGVSKLRFEHWKLRRDKWELSVERFDLISLISKIKGLLP